MDPTKIVPEGPRGPLKPPNDHFRGQQSKTPLFCDQSE